MQHYIHIYFSPDEGIIAFYQELLILAGHLTQYPDLYSFKRRLLNGMPDVMINPKISFSLAPQEVLL